jgi:nitrogen fixation NifU-like protein
MMTEAIKGKDKEDIGALFGKIHSLLTQQDAVADPSLGKLAALSGVREYPARVKCASLCWHTLNAALERSTRNETAATVSTE